MQFFTSLLTLSLLFVGLNSHAEGLIIPFEMNNGLIIIDVEIDGVASKFILDTGAGDVLVDNKDIDKKRIKPSEETFNTLSGAVTANTFAIKDILIKGKLLATDQTAYAVDMDHLESFTQINLGGILGGMLFGHKIKLDFITNTISTEISSK